MFLFHRHSIFSEALNYILKVFFCLLHCLSFSPSSSFPFRGVSQMDDLCTPQKNDAAQKSCPQALWAWAGLVDRWATWWGRKAMHALSCPTLCNPWDYSPLGSSVCVWGFSSKNIWTGCHFLLQQIFLTQGLNSRLLCLLPCRQILYHWATGEASSK